MAVGSGRGDHDRLVAGQYQPQQAVVDARSRIEDQRIREIIERVEVREHLFKLIGPKCQKFLYARSARDERYALCANLYGFAYIDLFVEDRGQIVFGFDAQHDVDVRKAEVRIHDQHFPASFGERDGKVQRH